MPAIPIFLEGPLIGCFSCQREGLTHVDWGGGPPSLLHLLLSPLLSFFCPPTSPLSLSCQNLRRPSLKCLLSNYQKSNTSHYLQRSRKMKTDHKNENRIRLPCPHRPYLSEICENLWRHSTQICNVWITWKELIRYKTQKIEKINPSKNKKIKYSLHIPSISVAKTSPGPRSNVQLSQLIRGWGFCTPHPTKAKYSIQHLHIFSQKLHNKIKSFLVYSNI